MNNRNWSGMSLEEQVEKLSSDMADLWKVHVTVQPRAVLLRLTAS